MKFLLVSDLHYALKQFDWAAAMAPNVDVVVVAGDHLDIAGHLEGNVQIVVILKYLRRMAAHAKIVVSSGNHDLDVRDEAGEKIARWMNKVRQLGIPTDGDSLELGATLVTICPWWDGPGLKQAVAAQLARDAAKPKRNWVWVHHAPPQNSPTAWDGKNFWGDDELNAWIETYRPDMVFSGHVHQAPFKAGGSWVDRIGETWIFNCGRQMGPTPTHIIVDTDAREAAWFSLAGAELVKLDAALERPPQAIEALPAWLKATTPAP
ncbi:MAG TPA: metallophosphoesterase family protein [Caulobacterales bacterium]|nr:metallophosphoesterase family protein [Caulobacterales bacterium]